MSDPSQYNYYFENGDLGDDTLIVIDLVGEEFISQPFRFVINLNSEDSEIDFIDVVNQPATLIMMRGGEPVKIHGLVANFQQHGRNEDWTAYRATLVPRIWRLSLYFQSRIYQNLNVEEVIVKVLENAGFSSGTDFRISLSESYSPSEYCVQYQETDLSFISRLMEHEGIHYYFEHEEDRDVMVITDQAAENPLIEDESSIPYNLGRGMSPGEPESVQEFICQEQLVAGKVALKDYNYRTPEVTLFSEEELDSDIPMPGLHYEYGHHYKTQGEGDRLAIVRMEEIGCKQRIMIGNTTCQGLRAGYKFDLRNHYRGDLNRTYLITKVTHKGSQGGAFRNTLGNTEGFTYYNDVTCIPADTPYRPPRLTPKPKVNGIMTAKNETAGGDYSHIDEQGRYKTKMFFDLEELDPASHTRPIRMAQPYSGPDYGMHFPNHAETEMVWACVNGDPDRPLALSTVPNPSNTSPSLAANNFQNILRSMRQNELRFDDTIGDEEVYINATYDTRINTNHDKDQTTGNNETLSIGNDRTKDVGHDENSSIGHDRNKSVGNNQSERVGKNKSINVGDHHSENIGKNKRLDVGKDHSESIGKNMNITIGSNLIERIQSNNKQTVGKNQVIKIGENQEVEIGKDHLLKILENSEIEIGKDLEEKVKGKYTENVTKEYELSAKKIKLLADDEIEIVTGMSKILMKKNGDIKITGKKIEIQGTQSIKLNAMKVTSEASMKNLTKGTMVNVEASGINTIKGALVKIN
ncbi:MAG: hypothetical protein B6244_06135 [Candidatus Cloacimonetes bacterium 4572_55]|nr:MAG: hypothetical protein B6244_06135 [Candidatus Cloacimonetes bacterium 4572_55]